MLSKGKLNKTGARHKHYPRKFLTILVQETQTLKLHSTSGNDVKLPNVNISRNGCLKTIGTQYKINKTYYRQQVSSEWDHFPFQLNMKVVEFCLPMVSSSSAVKPSRPDVISGHWIRLLLVRQDMTSQGTRH